MSRFELTTVADDEAVLHAGAEVLHLQSLAHGARHGVEGHSFETLPRFGERLATFATVNDVHFGETVCGLIEGSDVGPVLSSEPGERPYPEVMNGAAVAEIAALDPEAVIAKGDLTSGGLPEEYARFVELYGGAFGERLYAVRGNHDAYHAEHFCPPSPIAIELAGVRLLVLDTTWPGHAGGRVRAEDLEWLADTAADSDRPILVFGHHHVWDPGSPERPENYFGIRPDDSERLIALVAREPRIRGYFAGHTHRNRVRRFAESGDRPWVEVASVKEFPGTWAEYRVFEGGVLQVHRRLGAPEALRWSEKTRVLYNGAYAAYSFGELSDRCFAIPF